MSIQCSGPVKVLFAPFAESNPYQLNLRDGLTASNTSVEAAEWTPFVPLLRAYASARDPDIIHLHWLHEYFHSESKLVFYVRAALFLIQVAVLRILGVRVVWTVHNLFAHDFPFPDSEARLKNVFVRVLCDAVIVHCEMAIDEVIETYGLRENAREKMHVVPHGHSIDNYPMDESKQGARESLGIPVENTVLLYFGMIRPYKNVDTLIETFGAVSGPGTHLIVAGNPHSKPLNTEIKRLIRSTDQVTGKLTYIPDKDVGTYMHASDAVVLPFRDILTSGSAVLAMSYGRAFVAPELGCLPALVGSDGGAVLYDPDRSDGLAEALRVAESADLDAMGERNRERIAAFDWGTIGERTASVYRSVSQT